MTCRLSVVVCTYNRADCVRTALQSLVEQTADPHWYEIIVVDNNSDDDTAAAVREFSGGIPVVRLVQEPRQGLSHARNCGCTAATADWLAYIDDDARAHPDFVARALAIIDRYRFDCFGGMYLPWYPGKKPCWYRDSYASNGRLLERVGVLERGELSGGVIVFRKSVLTGMGGFPTNLGMHGQKIAYGEETRLQVELRRAGCVIGFDPDLRIDHLVSPRKQRVAWLLRSAWAHGYCSWLAYDRHPTIRAILTHCFHIFYHGLGHMLVFTPRLARRDYFLQNWCLDVLRPPVVNAGLVAGAVRRMLSPPENRLKRKE